MCPAALWGSADVHSSFGAAVYRSLIELYNCTSYLSMSLLFKTYFHVGWSSIHHSAGVWHQSPSPCEAMLFHARPKLGPSREKLQFSCCPPAIMVILGLVWGSAQLQRTQSTACFWWLFIQSECPTNGLPHVTRMSQTHTAVATSLKILTHHVQYSPNVHSNTNM